MENAQAGTAAACLKTERTTLKILECNLIHFSLIKIILELTLDKSCSESKTK